MSEYGQTRGQRAHAPATRFDVGAGTKQALFTLWLFFLYWLLQASHDFPAMVWHRVFGGVPEDVLEMHRRHVEQRHRNAGRFDAVYGGLDAPSARREMFAGVNEHREWMEHKMDELMEGPLRWDAARYVHKDPSSQQEAPQASPDEMARHEEVNDRGMRAIATGKTGEAMREVADPRQPKEAPSMEKRTDGL